MMSISRTALSILAILLLAGLPTLAHGEELEAETVPAEVGKLVALGQPAEPELTDPTVAPGELELLFLADGCTAETTCSSGVTLSCTGDPGDPCSSNSSGVWCGSCDVHCSNVDPYFNCIDSCMAQYTVCLNSCTTFFPCYENCYLQREACLNGCGSAPATSCNG